MDKRDLYNEIFNPPRMLEDTKTSHDPEVLAMLPKRTYRVDAIKTLWSKKKKILKLICKGERPWIPKSMQAGKKKWLGHNT